MSEKVHAVCFLLCHSDASDVSTDYRLKGGSATEANERK